LFDGFISSVGISKRLEKGGKSAQNECMTNTTVKKGKKTAAHDPIDFDAEIAELHVVLRALGEEAIMMRNGGKLAEKENAYSGDIVTEADKLIDAELVKRIASRHPTHHVRGEQGNVSGPADSPHAWIVTPIDGTRNFSKGLSFHAIAVAFLENNMPTMGMLYFPELSRFVYAISGRGVTDNGKPLKAFARPEAREMKHALIAGSTTRRKSGKAEILGTLRTSSLNMMNTGSTAYNAILLAERKIDAIVNADSAMFNIIALIPVLEEAGCVLSGFTEDRLDPKTSAVLEKDPSLFADDALDSGIEKDRVPFIAATNSSLISDIKKNILPVWKKAQG
jgi:fructose-1,6-bisphosphatase/inositol monophosphatase family enzyme